MKACGSGFDHDEWASAEPAPPPDDRGALSVSDALTLVGVDRVPLSEQIATRLIAIIGQDGLRPGDGLPSEARLAATFGVSRPVVREALRHLAALRVIKLTNGRTAEVLPVTSDLLGVYFRWAVRQDVKNALELQELRVGIESMSAGLAAKRAGAEQVESLQRLVRQMRSCLDDTERYVELDTRLHLMIVSATGNSLARHLTQSMSDPMRAVIEAGLAGIRLDPKSLEEMQEGHEAIVDAIAEGDVARARAVMEEHLVLALERMTLAGVSDLPCSV